MEVFILPKIRMLTSMAGHNFSYQFGEELDVTDEVSKAWVDAGIAEVVEEATTKKATLKKGDA
jgi:hypothetical protein